MAEIKDGGPAMPTGALQDEGTSLRDWFAGQALIGLLTCGPWVKGLDAELTSKPGAFKPYVAAHAYLMADEMLKAREATHGA